MRRSCNASNVSTYVSRETSDKGCSSGLVTATGVFRDACDGGGGLKPVYGDALHRLVCPRLVSGSQAESRRPPLADAGWDDFHAEFLCRLLFVSAARRPGVRGEGRVWWLSKSVRLRVHPRADASHHPRYHRTDH